MRGVAEGFFFRRLLLGKGSLEGEEIIQKCVVDRDGFEASGWEGNLGVFLGATSLLAVQMLFGEVFARKSPQ